MYVDDDTDTVQDEKGVEMIQREADRSTAWVSDNRMVCSGDKTKLLIMGTHQQRQKLSNENIDTSIVVCGDRVEETKSEKLLGLVVNNEFTWREYLYGESWRERKEDNFIGLIPKLSKRIGLLKRVKKFMKRDTFEKIADGIFTYNYCLPVFGNIWLNGDEPTRIKSFRKEDCRRLQVLQNRVMRLKTNLPQDTPCAELIKQAGDLSIHQAAAYHSLVLVHKIPKFETPDYLARKLAQRKPTENVIFPHRQAFTIPLNANLSIARSGFCYRASRVFNKLPLDLRSCDSTPRFKKEAKSWVRNNIGIKPP